MLNAFEQEIATRNIERVLSVVFQTTEAAQQDFQKSIADDVGYSQEFQIEKTGREIKEKLQAELTAIATTKTTLLAKMELLVGEIKTAPAGKCDQWEVRGYEKYLTQIPLKYTYAQIYPGKQDGDTKDDGVYPFDYAPTSQGGITPLAPKDLADKMRAYNESASDYVRRCVEEVKLRTVINNLSDFKKIKLTPQLATQLGF